MRSRPSPNLPRGERGFTLIEVLVIVMMVGLLMGGVTVFITGDGPGRRLDKAVEKFVAISDHISELAILKGEPIGLLLEPPQWRENPLDEGWRYRWQVMKQGTWIDLTEVPAVDLAPAFELQVLIDEQEWNWRDAPPERLPILAFYPSGEVTPFEIVFRHEDVPGEEETLLVDLWGKVVWKERQEQLEELEG